MLGQWRSADTGGAYRDEFIDLLEQHLVGAGMFNDSQKAKIYQSHVVTSVTEPEVGAAKVTCPWKPEMADSSFIESRVPLKMRKRFKDMTEDSYTAGYYEN